MKELKKIEESLDNLHKEFNSQIQELSKDTVEFHNAVIELSSKYPEHKDLLQFIVHINDRLETNQSIFSDIIIDSFNELVKSKKVLVRKLLDDVDEAPEEKSLFKTMISVATNMRDIKVVTFYIAVIIAIGGAVFAPDVSLEILKAIAKIAL